MKYFGLGDSISSDDYPDAEIGLRHNGAANIFGNYLWASQQVSSYKSLAVDGATIQDIVRYQLPRMRKYVNERMIITLTAGGNNISFGLIKYFDTNKKLMEFEQFDPFIENIKKDYDTLVNTILHTFPKAILILNNLYDPTDITNELPPNHGSWNNIAPLYSLGRRMLGIHIKSNAIFQHYVRDVLFADIYKTFVLKGAATNYEYGYYYKKFVIEPGAVGAVVIAKLWIEAFENHIQKEEEKKNDHGN